MVEGGGSGSWDAIPDRFSQPRANYRKADI